MVDAKSDTTWPCVSFDGTGYAALGYGGQFMFVLPYADLVIVHRVDTDQSHNVSDMAIGSLVRLILFTGGMPP